MSEDLQPFRNHLNHLFSLCSFLINMSNIFGCRNKKCFNEHGKKLLLMKQMLSSERSVCMKFGFLFQ